MNRPQLERKFLLLVLACSVVMAGCRSQADVVADDNIAAGNISPRNLGVLESAASMSSMGIRRHKHDAVLLPDGRILVTGGSDERDADGLYSTAELYNPATAAFTATGAMNLPRYKHERASVVLQNGLVLIAGGAARAEVYDPRTGTFSVVGGTGRMPGQYPAIALLSGGRVLITGGYGSDIRPRSEA